MKETPLMCHLGAIVHRLETYRREKTLAHEAGHQTPEEEVFIEARIDRCLDERVTPYLPEGIDQEITLWENEGGAPGSLRNSESGKLLVSRSGKEVGISPNPFLAGEQMQIMRRQSRRITKDGKR